MANSTSAGFKAGPAQSGAMEGLRSFLQKCNQYTGISTESVMNWGVYVLKPDQLFKHHSLLFCCKGTEFNFIVELLKDEVKKGNYYASIRAHIIDLSKYPQLTREKLGDVQMKIQDIISQAWATLKKMGCYSAIVNNCQDYCKQLSKNLGCREYWSDTEKVGAVGAIAALITFVVYQLFKDDK